VKKALGKRKAVLCGDIGCYTLANAAPLDAVDTCVCMGAGFTVPQGMYWVEPDVKHVGFVGDSTFFASGITGVANAVYNRADVTFFVLDNATTAMTGTQPHPGTGIRMSYDASPQDAANAISIEAVLRAMGVAHVVVADPLNHRESIAAASTAIDHAGVSAVIFRSPCINVTKPGPMLQVIADKCTLCRRCINTFGCPALVVRDRAVAIDESLCFGCKLCAQACPTYAIVRKDDAV
jgi:indolepyruvate ferredoxin oxidoreductase alpha subunit